jgi:hypothetical protein
MKKKLILATILLFSLWLQAQTYEMQINQKNGNLLKFSHGNIKKMTFTSNQTHKLIIHQKDSAQTASILTNINKITFNPLTGIEETIKHSKTNPSFFTLFQNYPNPFNPTTTIEYELPAKGDVSIQIFNVEGQLIQNMESGYQDAGIHRIVWNIETDQRQVLSNGVYFCKIAFNNSVQIIKLLYVK